MRGQAEKPIANLARCLSLTEDTADFLSSVKYFCQITDILCDEADASDEE